MEIEQQVATQAEVKDFSSHLSDAGLTPAPAAPPITPPAVAPVIETPATPAAEPPTTTVAEPSAPATPAAETTTTEPAATTVATEQPNNDLDLSLSSNVATSAPAATPAPVDYGKKYEELTKNPQAKFVLDWIESGKDIAELPNAFKTIDYSKHDVDTLTQNLGQLYGWTQEQIDAQREHNNSLSPLQAQMLKDQMVEALNRDQNGRLEQSTKELQKERDRQAQIMQQAQTDVEQEATGMIGKRVHGIELTKKDAEDFKKFVYEFNIHDANGNVDVKKLRNWWLGEHKLPLIQSETKKTAVAEATSKVLDEVTRPSVNGTAATKVPLPQPKPAPHEQASKALEAFMKGQN